MSASVKRSLAKKCVSGALLLISAHICFMIRPSGSYLTYLSTCNNVLSINVINNAAKKGQALVRHLGRGQARSSYLK